MAATTPITPTLAPATAYNSPSNTPSPTRPLKTDDHITGLIATPRAPPHRQPHQQIKGIVRRLKTPPLRIRRLWSSPFWCYNPASNYSGPHHKRIPAKISPDAPTCLITGQVYELSQQDGREWYKNAKEEIESRKIQEERDSNPEEKESSDDTDPFSIPLDEEDQRLNDLFSLAQKNRDANQAEIEEVVTSLKRVKRALARQKEQRRLAKLGTRAAKKAIEALKALTPRDERAAACGGRRG